MLVTVLVLLLEPRPMVAHSDYPDCSDLTTYRIYGGNTSHKGLSNRQGFDKSNMSHCDLSALSSEENCGDCDFKRVKPEEWYRFMLPLEEIVEVGSSQIADKCPEVGHCNGRNQIILTKSETVTRHKGSRFYRIVLSRDGKCFTLGKDKEHDLVEKNQCNEFYLYRFPTLFAQSSCGGGMTGDPWVPASICMDDSRKLSPFWVYIMVAISSALLVMITTFVVFSLYRHRQMVLDKRRRSTHMYHQAAEGNRQSTHSYADLVTMGFQVSVPPPTNGSIPRDTVPIVYNDDEDDGVVVFRNDAAADLERNDGWVGTDPLEQVSVNGSFDSGLVPDTETNTLSPHSNTHYLTPDELAESHRTLRLHSYVNVPKGENRLAVPQVNVQLTSQDYMIPDELISRNPQNSTPLSSPHLSAPISSVSSNFSSTLDPIAFAALFSHSESGSLSSPSDRSATPELVLEPSPGSRLRVPTPGDLAEGETCCIDSCTECPVAESHGDSETKKHDPKLMDKTSHLEADPLSVSWNITSGRRGNSRKCCNCRCSDRQTDRFFRIQSV